MGTSENPGRAASRPRGRRPKKADLRVSRARVWLANTSTCGKPSPPRHSREHIAHQTPADFLPHPRDQRRDLQIEDDQRTPRGGGRGGENRTIRPFGGDRRPVHDPSRTHRSESSSAVRVGQQLRKITLVGGGDRRNRPAQDVVSAGTAKTDPRIRGWCPRHCP